ncbi:MULTISPECIES: cation diffusion facilitator family transporter [Paenibacillus]|uniref:cation diffusion facilitator family transporter n=1 Tax=Paenibacillus TaxID=44249 RepID=UPI0007E41FED|nr:MULTISPECIES: cation diffusion facilitator family transporter [Paenibacillus]MCZ1269335.1 cation transporter [Paenibacillus tundrae]OAX48060.1 putative cation efflux system protein [Paenibacillus sp. AD87]SDK57267.1 cation diffusion facilitator family transporter [Paenibacillus sp. OK060]SEA75039.1 cation diffusion facilitator family transporter [Paenibacillus sp. 276b]SHN62114.1 cation diffusion facilitator family transporter [Paenibacillus sp. ov031]
MEQIKYDNLKLGEKGAIISIIAYICLTAIKMMIGYMSNSEALKADGLNNATDIIASIAVLIGLRLAQRPADKDHTYGHWKAETVASLVASFIMMAVGLQVLYEAITSVFQGKSESPDIIAAWTGIFCAAVMYLVYRYNKRLALKIKSQAVMAAAKDNISDAWVSIGTVIGIIGSQFGLPWLDPLTAVAVGFLICKTAWDIFREATHHLTDGFDEELIKEYRSTIANVDGVEAVKDLRARNYGNNAVVDVVILVRSDLDLQKAHDISTNVEDELLREHDVYTVHVHVEPDEAPSEVGQV